MMKNNYKYLPILFLLILSLSAFKIDAQTQFQNFKKSININEYLTEDHLNVEVKEFFIRQIRKTELVRPADNHEFVHFFLKRYDNQIKPIIKDRFINSKFLSKEEIIEIVNTELIPKLVIGFQKYKIKHANELINSNRKTSHFDLFNLGNKENFKGPGDPCTNADFETGDATGWDLSNGLVDGSAPFSYTSVTPTTVPTSSNHTIMTGAGTDAIGGFPVVFPGGTYSLMLGDGTGINYSAEDASQTFLVDPSSTAFSYSYAIVLEDAGHTAAEQPYFKINMYDQAGNPIQCGDYSVVAGGSPQDPDFIPWSGGVYMPWRTTFAPLNGYIGQNVTIEFIVGDCAQGGHFGYAYLDASCSPMEILGPDTITCTGPPTISAPPGAASYLWTPTGETTQSIVATAPGLYQVTVTPVTGAMCAITLDKMIYEFIDTITAVFSAVPDTICAGESVTFTDLSFVSGLGSVTGWAWDFDGNGTVDNNTQNPTYVYNTPGTYTVNLTASTVGCDDDTTMQIVVVPGSTANFTALIVCLGLATNFTDASLGGVDTWDWDFNNDGIIDNSTQNPSYTFPSTGVFPVTLSVSVGGSCPHDTTINVTVTQSATANFTAPTVCLGLATNFTDASSGGVDTWGWDFNNDGIVDNSTQNPSYTFPSAGTFPVNLAVSAGGACSHDTTINVTVSQSSTANFSTSPVCLGAATNFTDLSVGGVNLWDWDFNNDGIVDNSTQNPSYTFPSAGTYPVNLAVSASGACAHDTTINVIVTAQPTAAFTFTNECFGTTTGFTDLSNPNGGVITIWAWDFNNNGVVDNSSQNPSNGYAGAGTYSVELLVSTASGCADSITMQVVVNPIPFADFSATNICFGSTTTFNDLSNIVTGNINTWQWDFGDVSGTSVLQNPTYTYSNPGVYPVTLTITSDSGCINTVIDTAKVFSLPTADFVANNVCLNVAVNFIDNSTGNGSTITSWAWDFDGNGTTDNTNQNPTNVNPTGVGIFNVQLIVSTGAGCSDTIIQPLEVYPMPTANFSFVNACYGTAITFTDNSVVSVGNITNWSWNFGNSNSSIVQNPSENYLSEGLYNVQLIATSNNGCADTISQQIEVWPIPVANFTPTQVCLNAITQFNDNSTVSNTNTINSITQWNWDFNGQGNSSNQNPTFTFNTEGTFPTTLTLTSNNGCVNSVIQNVTVNPLPQISFGDPSAGCGIKWCATFINNTIINVPGSISSWQWNFGDGNSSPSMNPTHCYENKSYSVPKNFDVTLTATSNSGCVDSLTIPQLVTVYPKPLADFDYTPINADLYDREINFSDQSIIASSWDWDFGDGVSSSDNNPVHIYPDSGFYFVVLYIENTYGCKDTTSKAVRIKPAYSIWIPNTFTPDGGGMNEFFKAQGFGIKELHTYIFDRWGLLLFEGNQLYSEWNGTYKGKMCVEDVYVYRIKAKDVFDEWHEFIGKVSLLK